MLIGMPALWMVALIVMWQVSKQEHLQKDNGEIEEIALFPKSSRTFVWILSGASFVFGIITEGSIL